jgi:hypothetical protein
MVSGQQILITDATVIEGTPVVGAIAEVEAIATADGALTARRVHIDASTLPAEPPTTTPTPVA